MMQNEHNMFLLTYFTWIQISHSLLTDLFVYYLTTYHLPIIYLPYLST